MEERGMLTLIGHPIVCVEGTAFLYIYSGIKHSRQGGPPIERFKEQDATCVELED